MRSEAPADGNGHENRLGDHGLLDVSEVRKVGRPVSGFADGVLFGLMLAFLFVGMVLLGCEGIG